MVKIIQPKLLVDFYNAYNDWLDAGAVDGFEAQFARQNDLYAELHTYLEEKNVADFDNVVADFQETLKGAGLDVDYPFGYSSHMLGYKTNTMYLDKNQIRWVKSHLEELADLVFKIE